MRTFDPSQQLELLKIQCQELAPIIYSDQSHYIEVVRNNLLNSVRQALFVLITEKDQHLLNQISSQSRKDFYKQVENLVRHCSSFLTIEQLRDLVGQMERENEIKRDQDRREILSTIDSRKDLINKSNNSIDLTLDPPLENNEYYENLFSFPLDKDANLEQINLSFNFNRFEDFEKDTELTSTFNQGNTTKNPSDDNKENIGKESELDLLQSLFIMAGDAIGTGKENNSPEPDNMQRENNFLLNGVLDAENSFLPTDALALARWMDLFELAIARRLRNLSHALNVELLRVGIINNLLPISVLDAAINGQVESFSSESHILRLRLPIPNSLVGGLMEISCVLISISDLEFDSSSLRVCRNELKKHRLSLLSLVRKHRHWTSRSIAKEAHQEWLGKSVDESSPQ